MDNQKIGCFLSGLRKEKGLTQGELAAQFNVTHQSVSKWEKGDSLPDIHVLREIAGFYDITMEEILNGEKENQRKPKRDEKIQTRMNKDIVYLVFLVGILLSYGFFYIHETVHMDMGTLFGDFAPSFGNGYITLNIRGFDFIFNAAGISIYTVSMWIMFLSLLVLATFKSLNVYSIVKLNREHNIINLRLKFNVVTILEITILSCYIAMAIGMLFVSSVSMGIGFFIGMVFVALIYILNRVKNN